MRHDHLIILDNLKRKLFLKYELKFFILNFLIKNNFIKIIFKFLFNMKKTRKINWSQKNKPINKCFISGRSWYVNKKTRQTRFVFRIESYNGNLPGFKRASW